MGGWFEQLCSYISWRIIAFNAFKIRAKMLVDAGLKGEKLVLLSLMFSNNDSVTSCSVWN